MRPLQQNNRSTRRWTKIKKSYYKKLITTIGDLTSSELKSKDSIIHKVINQNNCEENTNKASINQISTKIASGNTQPKNDMNDLDKNNSVNEIKQQVETIKKNGTLVKSNNQKSEKSKTQISKAKPEKKSHIKIIENLGMEKEWGRMNKDDSQISRHIFNWYFRPYQT